MQDEEQPMGQPTQSQNPQTPPEATPPQGPSKDQPVMPDKPKKSKGGKWWIVLLVILGVILLAVGGAWFYAKSTPQYSLYMMREAAKAKDYKSFSKYFNADSIIDDLFDKYIAEIREELVKQYGEEQAEEAIQQQEAIIDQLKKSQNKEMENQIEQGNLPIVQDYGMGLFSLFLNTKVEKSGNDAKVAIKDESGKSVKFVMRKKNGYWEIYRIDMTLEEIQELNKGESSTDTPSTPTTTE